MPAAIPFAFSDATMPAASPAASAGTAMSEGARFFGQLVDAAVRPEAKPAAESLLPAVLPRDAMAEDMPAAAAAPEQAALDMPVAAVADEFLEADAGAEPLAELALLADQPDAPAITPDHVTDQAGYQDAPQATAAPEPRDGTSLEHAPEVPDVLPIAVAADDALPAERSAAPLVAALAAKSQSTDAADADGEAGALALSADLRKAAGQPAPQMKADAAEMAKLADMADASEFPAPSSVKDSVPSPAPAASSMAAAKPAHVEGSLPAALLTQAMAPIGQAPVAHGAHPYAAALSAVPPEPVVKAEAGRFGADVGVEIAKVAKGDGDSLLIRLDPREMGRVDVRLSFDRDGILRAVMSVDSPAALDMLRRESGELNRALNDAGVKSDGQSLRFDARSDGGASQGGPQHGSERDAQSQQARSGGDSRPFGQGQANPADYQPLRTTTQVDLIA